MYPLFNPFLSNPCPPLPLTGPPNPTICCCRPLLYLTLSIPLIHDFSFSTPLPIPPAHIYPSVNLPTQLTNIPHIPPQPTFDSTDRIEKSYTYVMALPLHWCWMMSTCNISGNCFLNTIVFCNM